MDSRGGSEQYFWMVLKLIRSTQAVTFKIMQQFRTNHDFWSQHCLTAATHVRCISPLQSQIPDVVSRSVISRLIGQHDRRHDKICR